MRSRYEELIRDNLELNILAQNSHPDIDRINEMVEIMLDVACSTKPTIRINYSAQNGRLVVVAKRTA